MGDSFCCGAYAIHILHASLRCISPSTEINLNSYLADVIENWEIFVVLSYSLFLYLEVFLIDLKWFLMQETINWEVFTSPTIVPGLRSNGRLNMLRWDSVNPCRVQLFWALGISVDSTKKALCMWGRRVPIAPGHLLHCYAVASFSLSSPVLKWLFYQLYSLNSAPFYDEFIKYVDSTLRNGFCSLDGCPWEDVGNEAVCGDATSKALGREMMSEW